MTEFFKALGANMLERLIVAVLAAVMTTYILQQRNEGRIEVLERDSAQLREHEEEDAVRFSAIETRMERCSTLLEIHMKEDK